MDFTAFAFDFDSSDSGVFGAGVCQRETASLSSHSSTCLACVTPFASAWTNHARARAGSDFPAYADRPTIGRH
jgi:hypothetical protein